MYTVYRFVAAPPKHTYLPRVITKKRKKKKKKKQEKKRRRRGVGIVGILNPTNKMADRYLIYIQKLVSYTPNTTLGSMVVTL